MIRLPDKNSIVSMNPFTGEILGQWEPLTATDAIYKLQEMHFELEDWQNTEISERVQLVFALGEHLLSKKSEYAQIITSEMGKPIREAEAEVEKCSRLCDYYAINVERLLDSKDIKAEDLNALIVYQPIGVILGIMPWNFPFWQVFRAAIPNILSGNGFALKHAGNVHKSAEAIEQAFFRSGIPKAAFTNICAKSKSVKQMISSEYVAAATFTGSRNNGFKVAKACGRYGKKCVLELGGSDPYLVLEDADIELAAEKCVTSRLINSGQSCIAAKRWIVSDKVFDEFLELCEEKMDKKVIGDPMERKTDIGPIARQDLRALLDEQVHSSIRLGAREVYSMDTVEEGLLYPPKILTDVEVGQPAFEEELFGPVAVMIKFQKEEEAIKIANATRYGLGGAIFSEDLDKAQYIAAEKLQVGIVSINDFVKSIPDLPFGGIKESGFGRELGEAGIYEFLNIKSISFSTK